MRTALERMARYIGLWTNTFTGHVEVRGGVAQVRFERDGSRTLGMRCAVESAVAELFGAMQAVAAEPLGPLKICFLHSAPDDVSAHEEFFQTPLEFGSAYDGVELPAEALDIPVRLADPLDQAMRIEGVCRDDFPEVRMAARVADCTRHVIDHLLSLFYAALILCRQSLNIVLRRWLTRTRVQLEGSPPNVELQLPDFIGQFADGCIKIRFADKAPRTSDIRPNFNRYYHRFYVVCSLILFPKRPVDNPANHLVEHAVFLSVISV